jgi:hypothetical protein
VTIGSTTPLGVHVGGALLGQRHGAGEPLRMFGLAASGHVGDHDTQVVVQ